MTSAILPRAPARTSPRLRWARAAALGALCATATPASAAPVDVNVHTTTLVYLRPQWRAGESQTDAPIVQWLGLTARGYENAWAQDVRFQLSAWGRVNPVPLIEEDDRDEATADVDLAFLQGRLLDRRVTLTLGRQLVTGGAARLTQLDGLHVDTRIAGGLALAAFGGLQTIPRFAAGRGDATFGGRLYYRLNFDTEVGASIIQTLDRGIVARRDAGVDARWAPWPELSFNASGVWSLVEEQLADAELAARWQVLDDVQLIADVRRHAPDLYVSRASIFSVFNAERRDMAGGGVSWQVSDPFGLFAEYHVVRMEDSGTGHDVNAQATLRLLRRTTAGLDARVLTVPRSGYQLARLWLRHGVTRDFALSVHTEGTLLDQDGVLLFDTDGDPLDEDVNGQDYSLQAGATASWAFARSWRAMLSGAVGSNPFFSRQFELSARLSYELSPTRGARP